jgi:hypothetical protein
VSPGARVLLLGIGSGRHVPVLRAAGLRVEVIEADPARAAEAAARWAGTPGVRIARARYRGGPLPFAFGFEGALATHALLHGTPGEIAAALAAVGNRLSAGAPFHFTLGSTRDPRCGRGTQLGPATWAPQSGDEAGVPHTYLDEPAARALLAGWEIDELTEGDAAQTAGRWAHADEAGGPSVHWFVRARRAL